jgi:hypothetical protein
MEVDEVEETQIWSACQISVHLMIFLYITILNWERENEKYNLLKKSEDMLRRERKREKSLNLYFFGVFYL